jgi:protein tyrosine/serine phosphatase
LSREIANYGAMNRGLTLEGVDNFRDFGGYRTRYRRQLKRGRLWRSASHGRATDTDLEAIAALGIAVIVDLRRQDERERDPSRRPVGFVGRVIVHDDVDDEDNSWVAHITGSDLSEAAFHAYMLRYYAEAPYKPRILALYRRYFEALEHSPGPVLIHCAAGKDRTGILAALTHHLLGVGEADILADFLATNDPARIKRRMPQVRAHIEELAGRAPAEAVLRVAMGVDETYLRAAWRAMGERHGGVGGYLSEALGVDDSRAQAIRAALLD